ncbi:MAG TPA: hypothetical protein P5531_07180 [Bacteroidales bacterium]|nr:hypothetical protein [Bacteroidales bacterium]HSA43333.1 hypothetical protein [Bacteroidales bacterium]
MKHSVIKYFFLLMLPLPLGAQILIDRNDMPDTGDTMRRSQTLTMEGMDYVSTGNNHQWDFSSLDWVSQRLDTFVAVNSVPLTYQLVFNNIFDPNRSTIASPQPVPDSLGSITLQDVYMFFRETNTYFGFTGLGATVSGITLPIKYNSPDMLYRFPLTPGTADSSDAAFSLSIPGIGYLSTARHRVNHVDGWGSITTPFGTFPCIRVKSVVTESDSIYLDSLNAGYPLNRVFTEYKWLTDNLGLPVVEITEEGQLITVLYLDSARTHLHTVSGTVSYHNTNASPLPGITLQLVNNLGFPVAQTDTDSTGHYFFGNVPSGNYTIELSGLPPWQSGNAVDALLILQHFTGMQQLAGLTLTAADTDDSGYINATDALMVVQRFVQMIGSFPAGDWVTDNPPVTVGSSDVIHHIKVQCVGDIDGSYQ